MTRWAPDILGDVDRIKFETTFADETRGEGRIACGGGPYAPEFMAQVDGNVDLRWVPEIRRRTGLTELKYQAVRTWIVQIDSIMHGMMQETWRKTNIVITDPKPALSSAQDYFSSFIEPKLLECPWGRKIKFNFAAHEILTDTPLIRLATLADRVKPGLWLPDEKSTLPKWASPREWSTRFKGSYQKAQLFATRLNSSYFELCDDDRLDEAIRQASIDCGATGCHIDIGRVLLEFSAAHRVFDEGHDSSLAYVEQVRKESLEPLLRHRGIALPPGYGLIEPRKSTSNDELQAADLAAGFAKEDYQISGIAGVLSHFRAVLYNGKLIH